MAMDIEEAYQWLKEVMSKDPPDMTFEEACAKAATMVTMNRDSHSMQSTYQALKQRYDCDY